MQPFVAALGTELGLTSKDIADIIWLALQMQNSDGVAESTTSLKTASPEPKREARSRLTSPDFTPPIEEKPESKSQQKSAELHQPQTNQPSFSQQLALRVPDARSLREPLSLARSLKPLLRRVVTGWSTTLDEAATVERIADEQLWLPVLKPALEPWLDLALVVDESLSMQIWQRTIAELQRLLSHYGVFRDVRVWRLVTDEPGEAKLYPGIGATARRQAARRPSELIDPSGRRLVLVATDCVSSGWQDGSLLPALKVWAKTGPLAIVQMLPEWLWSRTGLGFASAVKLQSLLPGVPNQQLIASDVPPWDEIDLDTGIKVPVVTLEPEPFTTWTEMVAGKGGVWSPGFVLEEAVASNGNIAQRPDMAVEGSAEQRVQRFRVTASPMARRLAGLLAAAPVISLPVVRIIQDQLLPESRQVHVAEVFLGGLLTLLGEVKAETNPEVVQYDFVDGVREVLMGSVPTRDSVNVLEEVSKFVAERLGLSLEAFAAVLRNPQQTENRELASQSRPFAMVAAQILRQMGNEYAQLAEELDQSNQQDFRLNLEFDGGFFKDWHVGGSLPVDASTYVVRQADEDLYKELRAGNFCYILSPRQTGKSSLRVRVMKQLQAEGIACGVIDISTIGSFSITPAELFLGVVRRLARVFGMHLEVIKWWQQREGLSPVQRLGEFIEEILLVEITQPIVIFIDEIDSILSHAFKDDFFGFIRSCYNQRAINTGFVRLTFALFGVATFSDLVQDKHRTPFNIGKAIPLFGFQLNEIQPLAQGLIGKAEDPQAVLREILAWTGGQPFLTQKLCQLVLERPNSIPTGNERQAIEQLVRNRVIENWETQDVPEHLKTIRYFLLRNSQITIKLLSLYQEILQQGEIPKDGSSEQAELRLSGLTVVQRGELRIANQIYMEIFNQQWVDAQLSALRPYADAFNAWISSNCQNESFLLRGKALQDALSWATDKNLSDQDYQFINASQELERRTNQRNFEFDKQPIKIFYSYSRKDLIMRHKLEAHLSALMVSGQISTWHDLQLEAGVEWEPVVLNKLDTADIILILVSANFLASKYCYGNETKRAIARHDAGEARVIPIILRPCDWNHPDVPFSKLNVLPTHARPITKWADPEEGLAIVAQRIREIVDQLRAKKLAEQQVEEQQKRKSNREQTKQQEIEQVNQPETETKLASQKSVDYTELRNLLQARQWKESDQETYRVMIQAVGGKEGDWFNASNLMHFPSVDLVTINNLWARYSNGKFGFSAQKQIWQECGSPTGYSDAWERFGDFVGWRVDAQWITSYKDIQFSFAAPRGHLPSWFFPVSPTSEGGFETLSYFLSRSDL